MSATKLLCSALSAIPGVQTARSRFGSRTHPAWKVAGREFAHLHSESLLDLRLPRSAQLRLRADARAHFRARPSEWIEMEFHSEQDVDDLLALARMAAAARATAK